MKKAFTLAETLIVIGIIGVVAALTLPNLNHATGDKEAVTRVKKTISQLTDAHDRAFATYGNPSEWSDSCREHIGACWIERVGEFLKVSKKCSIIEEDEENGIEGVSCDSLLKGDMENIWEGSVIQLADGLTLATANESPDCSINLSDGKKACFWLIFDIDGANKGKNQFGRDIFLMYVGDEGLLYPKWQNDVARDVKECISMKLSCSWWIMEHDNMDYLKADSEGKCPNGTELNENNFSCN